MFHSVLTLKRSLLQICSGVNPSCAVGAVGACRSLSYSAASYWEGSYIDNEFKTSNNMSDDSTATNSSIASTTTNSNNNNSNGIIRFTMTPKPQHQHASILREYGTSNKRSSEILQPDHQLDACDNPFFDRTVAAEQMAKQMEDSYYYASFKATANTTTTTTSRSCSSNNDKEEQEQQEGKGLL